MNEVVCQWFDRLYRRVCNSFAQLGVRGISIIFSSGDFGVGGGDCKTNNGKNETRFQPIFPATCKLLSLPPLFFSVSDSSVH
jgi:hypothetical protein